MFSNVSNFLLFSSHNVLKRTFKFRFTRGHVYNLSTGSNTTENN